MDNQWSYFSVLDWVRFWLSAPEESYRLVSGLILAWSLSVSWTQLVAFGEGNFGRVVGMTILIVVGAVYFVVHHYFQGHYIL